MRGFQGRRNFREQLFAAGANEVVGLARPHASEIARQTADIVGDRHVIVVEDDEDIVVQMAGVIESLEGHACGHRSVADDSDAISLILLHARSDHHAQCSADRGAGVANTKGVVRAFIAIRECRQAARLTHGQHLIAASGENLVRVCLMSDIPHQPVFWCVEDIMQRNSQLDDAQAGTEVPTGLSYRVEQEQTQFTGQCVELVYVQFSQVGRAVDLIQQRCMGPGDGDFFEHLSISTPRWTLFKLFRAVLVEGVT